MYQGSGVGLLIDTAQYRRHVVRIRKAVLAWKGGADSTSVGVRLRNTNWSEVYAIAVSGFAKGLELQGDGAGTCYNTIQIGRIYDNMIGLAHASENGGWTNGNLIQGGAIRINSANAGAGSGARRPDVGERDYAHRREPRGERRGTGARDRVDIQSGSQLPVRGGALGGSSPHALCPQQHHHRWLRQSRARGGGPSGRGRRKRDPGSTGIRSSRVMVALTGATRSYWRGSRVEAMWYCAPRIARLGRSRRG